MLALRLLGLALLAYGVYMLTGKQAKASISAAYDAMPEGNAAVDVVARTIWGEARGEGYEGMQAVANVIANRVARPGWWGRDWRGVCMAPYQFSCWNANDPNLIKLSTVTTDDAAFAAAVQIATEAVTGQLDDITGGAVNYHATSIQPPAWAADMTVTAEIGRHVFYA